jgi:uncharacterized protein (TIGR03083 family)
MATVDEQLHGYGTSRERIDAMTRSLNDRSLATEVPCCPGWSVKDLVGHLCGVLEDRRDARMPTEGQTFTDWTDAQVERHRGEPIAEVLDTWAAITIDDPTAPPSLATLAFDVVTHEHDLCHALGIAGDRTSESVRVGADRACERTAIVLEGSGAPGVIVTTPDGVRRIEGGAASIALETTDYGLVRLVTGRVSRAQAESMTWTGDPAPVLDAMFADNFFTLQPVDVVEADLG